MKFSDLQFIHENTINIIEFFSVGIKTEKPSTLFDVKGERKYVRLVNEEGLSRVFALDNSFRECVNVSFIRQDDKYVWLTDKGLNLMWSLR